MALRVPIVDSVGNVISHVNSDEPGILDAGILTYKGRSFHFVGGLSPIRFAEVMAIELTDEQMNRK